MSNEDLKKIFFERLSVLSSDDVRSLSESSPDGRINNVIARLSRQCYVILVEDLGDTFDYRLIFIIYDDRLEGYCLDLSLSDTLSNKLTYIYATYLSNSFKALDPINIHNTFQSQLRSSLEKRNFFTYCNSEVKGYKDPTFFTLTHRGVVYIDFIDRMNVYKEIFPHTLPERSEGQMYIYLMFNEKNNYVKIGKSNNPRFREKTLQAEDPEITLLTFWKAPYTMERDMHRLFSNKRKRGEWFDLQLADMNVIKKLMSEYE